MAKLTDARVVTLQNFFDSGDQPTEAQFDQLILWIQQGIEEHQHDSTGDGDGTGILNGPITMADDQWIGIGAALERIVFDAAGDIAVMGANFGAGTLTPGEAIGVEGHIALKDEGWYKIGNADIGTNVVGMGHVASEGLYFDVYKLAGGGKLGANSMDAMVIRETTGHVGIGETDPGETLSVKGHIGVEGDDGFDAAGEIAALTFGPADSAIAPTGICGKNGTGLIFGVYKNAAGGDLNVDSLNAVTITQVTGAVKVASLAGAGARNVVAAADGTLSAP